MGLKAVIVWYETKIYYTFYPDIARKPLTLDRG
jgi:hypothetical protein